MIPLKLTLHNFMCYRNPDPLDFTGLHLACLAGNNGHGKSALLDAMTWALWGKARSNQADDLIHLGQTEMWVDFEFTLGANRYRVLRSRERRGRSGKSDLQLQVWDGLGEFRPISESTIRQTEQRIVDLLRMDYDTFINSAFLVQGRADEFTIKPPNQRKQILGEILGLGLYDQFEAGAKERARQRRDEANRIDAQIAAIDQELAQRTQFEAALQEAQAQVIDLGDRLRTAEQTQRSLHEERQELVGQQRALDDLEMRLKQGQRELADIEAQLQRDQGNLALDRDLAERRSDIEAGYQALQRARQEDRDWNQSLAQQVELQAQHSRLTQEIAQSRNHLEGEQRLAEDRVGRLQAQADRIPALKGQLAQVRAELDALGTGESQRDDLLSQTQALREEYVTTKGECKRIEAVRTDIEEKLALLDTAEARCPVCGQPLGAEERAAVILDFRRQDEELASQLAGYVERLQEIAEVGKGASAELEALNRTLQDRTQWQRQEAQLEAQLAEVGDAIEDLAEAQRRLESLGRRLAAQDYAGQARAALAKVEDQLAALGYDGEAHERARNLAREGEPYQDQYNRLQAALTRMTDLQTRIEGLQARRQRWQAALSADDARRDELVAAVARLPQVVADLRACSAEVDELEAAERRARQHLGAAQQRLDACQRQAEQRVVLAGMLQATRDQQVVFEELQTAFGKKGLQAMIIEAAIPEIEAEANGLLNRMTDGRMAVRLETQRETKTTQELRETLDIILSDELGSRDYALFSGGEAFRANFAIRIALSKLLARRAGARLQTLVIDEGFGTQDAQGRERLVEAINSIQDDFERILVITHIDELRDHFPTRIDVVKGPDGSQISVS